MTDDTALTASLRKKVFDREWRMDNLYYIQNKFGKKVKFVRNESQMEFWWNMWYLNTLLKDRQRGFSTLFCIFILDSCLFNSNIGAGIIDITISDAKKKLDKIDFAYTHLPKWVSEFVPLCTDAKEAKEWSNGSSVFVGTSHRGGTLQILLVSERGKIAARYPERAREIRTGAMNTVARGNFVFDESTAEGSGGEFFEDCVAAQELQDAGTPLTAMDSKFHFFGWWMGTENEIDPTNVLITKEMAKYFDDLEVELGFGLSARKRAWYVKKKAQQKDDMTREYPSTPAEAFESSVDGAYYRKEMIMMKREGRICAVPYEPSVPVDTFWDIGMNDQNFIWCFQLIGRERRFINCIFGSGEGFPYYARRLQETGYLFGRHFLPHDGAVKEMGTGLSRKQSAENLGIKPVELVPRAMNTEEVLAGINVVRDWLPTAWIDEVNCAEGLAALRGYTKEWDPNAACFKRSPLHNHASNGADAMRTGAVGYKPLTEIIPFKREPFLGWGT